MKKSPDDIRAARRARREARQRSDDGAPPADIDEFRYALARRIARFVGNKQQSWRGCREPMCRRQRACAAPRNHCSNAPALPPDPERTVRAVAEFHRALRAHLDQ